MAEDDSDHDLSDVELEIVTAYVSLCIEHIQEHYMKNRRARKNFQKDQTGSLMRMTDAIKNLTEVSRQRHNRKSERRRQSVESIGGSMFSMAKAVDILNSIEDIDDFTFFKVIEELHNPESRSAFILMTPDRRRGWMDWVLIIEKILLILTSRNLEKRQFRLALLHKFDRYCESSFKCVGIEFRFRSTSTASNSFCIYISLLTRVNSQILKELMEFNSGGILILPVKLSISTTSIE
uniref:At2g29880-like C-terminal domain-containing protein n=1 Tax=Quercus lobata TaxID=97700 RepID=A0A7N2MH40_QUELO